MESGAISNGQITASSEWNSNEAAHNGRLHLQETDVKTGGWVAATTDVNQWLQIDLIILYSKVTRVATQGRNSNRNFINYVTNYNLTYSTDAVNFRFYREHGQVEAKVK